MSPAHRFGRLLVTLISTAAVVLLLASCARRESPVSAVPVPGEPPAGSSPARQATAGESRMLLTDAGRARSGPSGLPPVDPRESAAAALRLQALPAYPLDFVIGPIGVATGEAERVRSYAASVLALLVRDDEGESPEPAADEGSARETLASSMLWSAPGAEFVAADLREAYASHEAYASDEAYDSRSNVVVRVGTPRSTRSAEYSVPFRLLHPQQGFVGELIVVARDGEWYTIDLQAVRDDDAPRVYRPGSAVAPVW